MTHDMGPDIFCNYLYANFHRRGSREIHGGEKGYQLTHMDRLPKNDLINRQGDHIPSGIPTGACVCNLIQELQNGPPVHISREICHVRCH